jgi:hypothetical protein
MSLWQNIIFAAIAVSAAAGSVALRVRDNRRRTHSPRHQYRTVDLRASEYVDHGHQTVVMPFIDPEATQDIPTRGGVR